VKAESKPIAFRADAAQPFDDRCLSWQLDRRTVSIWTAAGRMTGIPFRCSAAQFGRLRDHRQGESDLVHRDGKWYLYATCEVPEPELTVDVLPLRDGHEYQPRPPLANRYRAGFVKRVRRHHDDLVGGLVDDPPVKHPCPPAALGSDVTTVDDDGIPAHAHHPDDTHGW